MYHELLNQARPRHFKTHLPAPFLPEHFWTKQPKMIHITRNSKDSANAFYKKVEKEVPIEFDEAECVEMFEQGTTLFGPYTEHENLFKNLKSTRNYTNVLYLTFEEFVEVSNGQPFCKSLKFLIFSGLGIDYNQNQ